MAGKRHRRGYKFTEKKQSKKGILAFVLAIVSMVIFGIVIFESFQVHGKGSMYLGSAGVASMIIGAVSLVLAVGSLREENSFKLFPYLATGFSFLATGVWIAMYVAGFIL